jgi:hypothetical protein
MKDRERTRTMKAQRTAILIATIATFVACTSGTKPGDAVPASTEATADTVAPSTAIDTTTPAPTEAATMDGTREDAPDVPESTPMSDEEQAQAFLQELPGTYESRERRRLEWSGGGSTDAGPYATLNVSRMGEATILTLQHIMLDGYGYGESMEAEAVLLEIRKMGELEYELKMEQRTCKTLVMDPMEGGSKELSDATNIPFTIRVDAGSSSRMRFKASKVNSACLNVWTLDRYKFKRKR